VLTEGGVKIYAVCLKCQKLGGHSLRRAWWTVIGWIATPILILLAVVLVLGWLFPGR
jgi:hypothetical protein